MLRDSIRTDGFFVLNLLILNVFQYKMIAIWFLFSFAAQHWISTLNARMLNNSINKNILNYKTAQWITRPLLRKRSLLLQLQRWRFNFLAKIQYSSVNTQFFVEHTLHRKDDLFYTTICYIYIYIFNVWI